MNLTTFAFLFTGICLNATAQLLLKAGTNAVGAIHLSWGTMFSTGLKLATQLPILGGLTCYVLSVVVWIVGLSRVEVSIAYPMLSMGYVVNALLAYWLFGEALGPMRWAGMLLIMAGVIVIVRS